MANVTNGECPPAVELSSLNMTGYEFHGWNTSGESRPLWETLIKGAAYAFVFVVALVGNTAVTCVVTCNVHMRTTTNFYLVNLAVADLTISLFCMWTHLIKHLAYPHFVLGPFMCRVDAFIQMTAMTSSVLTLTAISCDRFFAVMFPLRARFTKQRANGVIISVVWTLAMAASMPFLFHREYTEIRWKDYVQPQCGDVWPAVTQYDPWKGVCEVFYPTKRLYYTFFSLALFFLPVTIMSIMYILLLWKLWVSPLPGEQSNAAVSIQSRAKRKVIKMVLTVLIVFIVCWMPLQALTLYGVYGHEAHEHGELPDWFPTVEYLTYFIAYSNSAINPIIYCGFNETFRRGMLSMLSCKHMCECKRNSFRSARTPTNFGGSDRRAKPNVDQEMAEMVVVVRGLAKADVQTRLLTGKKNETTGTTLLKGELNTELFAFSSTEAFEKNYN